MNDQDRAIVVGVRVYPGLQDLDGPENDAVAFRAWLVDPNGGGLPDDAEHVRLILSSDFGPPFSELAKALPTSMELERAFEWLDDQAEMNFKAGKGRIVGRRLYLYFSGHGFAPGKDDAALLMANAAPRRIAQHIAGRLWADWFYEAGYFDEIALFMDCCRDSYTTVPLRPVTFNAIMQKQGLERRKRFYAYGTKWDRKAWERVMPADNKVHSVFTTALLAGLRGQAADPATGIVSTGSLRSYLYNNMRHFFSQQNRPNSDEEPDIVDRTSPADPLIFAKVALLEVPKISVRIHVPGPAIGGEAAIFGDDATTPLLSTPAVPTPWEVRLPKGLYEVGVAGLAKQMFRVDPSQESIDVQLT